MSVSPLIAKTSSPITLETGSGPKQSSGMAVAAEAADSAQISSSANQILNAAQVAAPSANAEKIAQLKAQISSGVYQPNPMVIAQNLLSEAMQNASQKN